MKINTKKRKEVRKNMAEEKLIYPPTVGDGIGNKIPYESYTNAKVGQICTVWAGAPGTGKIVHKITRKDETGVYGIVIENTMRMLEPYEVM